VRSASSGSLARYPYRCPNGHDVDVVQSMFDPLPEVVVCPEDGCHEPMTKQLTAPYINIPNYIDAAIIQPGEQGWRPSKSEHRAIQNMKRKHHRAVKERRGRENS